MGEHEKGCCACNSAVYAGGSRVRRREGGVTGEGREGERARDLRPDAVPALLMVPRRTSPHENQAPSARISTDRTTRTRAGAGVVRVPRVVLLEPLRQRVLPARTRRCGHAGVCCVSAHGPNMIVLRARPKLFALCGKHEAAAAQNTKPQHRATGGLN